MSDDPAHGRIETMTILGAVALPSLPPERLPKIAEEWALRRP